MEGIGRVESGTETEQLSRWTTHGDLYKKAGHCPRIYYYTKKNPDAFASRFFGIKSLAVTYFHMGKPHTIIGAKQFHFRVRYGIGWVLLAIAAKQTGLNQCH